MCDVRCVVRDVFDVGDACVMCVRVCVCACDVCVCVCDVCNVCVCVICVPRDVWCMCVCAG